jgi:hypothetical protein
VGVGLGTEVVGLGAEVVGLGAELVVLAAVVLADVPGFEVVPLSDAPHAATDNAVVAVIARSASRVSPGLTDPATHRR